MKFFFVFTLWLCCFAIHLQGQNNQRDSITAQHLAEEWIAAHTLKTSSSALTKRATKLKLKAQPMGWLCTSEQQFVIISKDKELPTILGYGTFVGQKLPTALQALLRNIPNRSVNHYPLDGTKWKAVSPMLTTQHGFGSPYNDLCPYYTDDEGNTSTQRCVAGCVAIAMEQVLTYYHRTYTLQDTLHGWTTNHYTINDLLPGYTIHSQRIIDNYDKEESSAEQRNEVAKLMYALGVASHMNWGLSASGTNTSRLIEPLKRAFALKHVVYLDSYLYDPVAYWTYLAQTLAAQRPIYYAGATMTTEGHAFVLDGLDENGLFHVNWGYNGDYDGYFRLDVLALREPWADRNVKVDNGFFCNQEALVVCPDEVTDLVPPDSLHRSYGDVTVDSMWTIDAPSTACRNRIALIVRNTTNHALTTTFALLQNEPTDTALIKQADWLAYTGCTLPAAATDTLIVHTNYTKVGKHLLSITTDGEQILHTISTDITDEGTNNIEFDTPQLSFPELGSVRVKLHFKNPLQKERAAATFMSDIVDNETNSNYQKTHRIYLNAAADTTIAFDFKNFEPGKNYTYRLHHIWPVVYSASFVLPTINNIVGIKTDNNKESKVYYFNIDGRLQGTERPKHHGIYLMQQNGITSKIIVQ